MKQEIFCSILPLSSAVPVFTAMTLVWILTPSYQVGCLKPHDGSMLPDPSAVRPTCQGRTWRSDTHSACNAPVTPPCQCSPRWVQVSEVCTVVDEDETLHLLLIRSHIHFQFSFLLLQVLYNKAPACDLYISKYSYLWYVLVCFNWWGMWSIKFRHQWFVEQSANSLTCKGPYESPYIFSSNLRSLDHIHSLFVWRNRIPCFSPEELRTL